MTANEYTPVWRDTTPDKDLPYTCDLCGAPANTIHIVPWVMERVKPQALFACHKHDPGGYWFEIQNFFNPKERWGAHLESKGRDGEIALELIYTRIETIRREMAQAVTK